MNVEHINLWLFGIQLIAFLIWIDVLKPSLWIKLFLRRFFLIKSFCKECGKNVTDFHASDELWKEVMNNRHHVVCYECFCKKSGENYKIIKLK